MAHPRKSGRQERRQSGRGNMAVWAGALALALACGGSFLAARAAADFIETRSAADVRAALADYPWAEVTTDGLRVRLSGTAPNELQRFRARSSAAAVVDAGRVVDDMQVAAAAALATPAFEIELLRSGDEVSIIGLVPAGLDRQALVERLQRQPGVKQVSDLLEAADYPVPDGWEAAYGFGLRAAQLAPRAKISIAAGAVTVRALADSPEDQRALEAALNRLRPREVALTADISAPRPVIAPFTLRFVKDATGTRFDACAADSAQDAERILSAGRLAGSPEQAQCTLALGAPSARWADAAVAAIEAVSSLGAGSVTLSDSQVALFAPADVPADRFDEVVGRLQASLPAGFTLESEHEKLSAAVAGPAEFTALSDAGGVSLRGRIGDERMRQAVESLARARFDHVDSALRSDSEVPSGWTLRAIAAIEALQVLDRGNARVTPDLVRISGVSGQQTASDMVAARLAQRLGPGARYELAIRYDRRLDPALGLPNGAECVDRLNAIMQESEIGFEPNRAVIAGDPQPVLERLAETMRQCADFRIEIGGHTDSQGSEAFNAELSRARAQAVMAAMQGAGIDVGNMTVRGYGESRPIAENDTEAGREANRRIEFLLLADDPVVVEVPAAPMVVSGVTDPPEVLAARAAQSASLAATGAVAPALGLPGDPAQIRRAATRPAASLLPQVDAAQAATQAAERAALPELAAARAAVQPLLTASLAPAATGVSAGAAASAAVTRALTPAAIEAATRPAREALRDLRPQPRPSP